MDDCLIADGHQWLLRVRHLPYDLTAGVNEMALADDCGKGLRAVVREFGRRESRRRATTTGGEPSQTHDYADRAHPELSSLCSRLLRT
jgi:hypothetical protein